MARKTITQREAHRLRKRVNELEDYFRGQRKRWSSDWPGGIPLCSLNHHETAVQIATARKLRHAVVVTVDGEQVRFFAAELPKEAGHGVS